MEPATRILHALMMDPYHFAFAPFIEYGFMRRALVACLALAAGGTPLGIFLLLRRMALVGDAMSHALLPGVAIAFLVFGLSLPAMTAGGLIAGLIVALAAGAITRLTPLKEDASFTGCYLMSLAVGVLIISLKGNAVDLMHVLFGNVLAVDNHSLVLIAGISSLSLLTLAVFYRGLVMECFDPGFMRIAGGRGSWMHSLLLALLALNLVAAFQAIGTLMALGLMVLPAIAARFWSRTIDLSIAIAIATACAASYIGLLLSYHYALPTGPAIVLTAGACYIGSLLLGRYDSLLAYLIRKRHYAH